MSINNREDLNKYYGLLNELIDVYVEKWKIRPTRLKKYLKKGTKRFENFLLRNNLSDINGISVVLSDIIDDRASMEKDGILKFESFNILESNNFGVSSLEDCFNGIERADIKMEKILADYFDTNLSDVTVVDSKKHTFSIDTWSEVKNVIIFSKEDIDLIKDNILDYLYHESSNKKIELIDKISVDLSKIVDKEPFGDEISGNITDKLLKEILCELLNAKFKGESLDHFIFIGEK